MYENYLSPQLLYMIRLWGISGISFSPKLAYTCNQLTQKVTTKIKNRLHIYVKAVLGPVAVRNSNRFVDELI
jgi:hypothetical protein